MKDTSRTGTKLRCSSMVSLPPGEACLLTCTRRGHTDACQAAALCGEGSPANRPFPVEPGDWPLQGSLQRKGLQRAGDSDPSPDPQR